jgi:hypothetical protein
MVWRAAALPRILTYGSIRVARRKGQIRNVRRTVSSQNVNSLLLTNRESRGEILRTHFIAFPNAVPPFSRIRFNPVMDALYFNQNVAYQRFTGTDGRNINWYNGITGRDVASYSATAEPLVRRHLPLRYSGGAIPVVKLSC